jgi:hypothetical protein
VDIVEEGFRRPIGQRSHAIDQGTSYSIDNRNGNAPRSMTPKCHPTEAFWTQGKPILAKWRLFPPEPVSG